MRADTIMRAAVLVSLTSLLSVGCGDSGIEDGDVWVFNAETNRLNAYDVRHGDRKRTVIPSHADDPNGRDINGQICFFPDGSRRFIAGEDTNQPDPPPGWGIFQLQGERFEELTAQQIGRLVPTYQPSADNPENYGCGFLSGGRVLTTDIGNTAEGPATGQLIVWFPPLDQPNPSYCKLDTMIATAGGIAVDEQERVYVASARLGGVSRYTGPFPTSANAAGGCGRRDGTGAPLVDAITKELFLPIDGHIFSPYSLVFTPQGNTFVASVFNGVVAEYDAHGRFLREVLSPPPDTVPPFPTGNPTGIGIDREGTLYFADLGLQVEDGIGPGPLLGTVKRIRFRNGEPLPPETIDRNLNFPDGIGILEP
jgi:hypothetical protein